MYLEMSELKLPKLSLTIYMDKRRSIINATQLRERVAGKPEDVSWKFR